MLRYTQLSRGTWIQRRDVHIHTLVIIFLTFSISILPTVHKSRKPSLKFQSNDENVWTFKILQLADLHFGEDQWTDWGPEQDRKSIQAIQYFIEAERPDLVVLSGDQITGLNIDNNATSYYQKIIEAMIEVDEILD